MDERQQSAQQGHRLIQAGMLLFLPGLLAGLFVPKFAVPKLGLSAHLLGILRGFHSDR